MRLASLLLAAALLLAARPASALDAGVLKRLADDDSDEKIAAIEALSLDGSRRAAALLQALADDRVQAAGDRILITDGDRLLDAATGQPVSPAPEGAGGLTLNNRVRRHLEGALAALRVLDPDRKVRLGAAQALGESAPPELAPLIERALAKETDADVKELLLLADAQARLRSDDPAARLAAVRALDEGATQNVQALLTARLDPASEPDAAVRAAARASLHSVERRLLVADVVSRVFSGLSLGSILLLAALGLAITYGIMGVINMAHGELLMVGAYSGYAVQVWFRGHLPAAQDWYVVAALPVAFAAAFTAGVIMERLGLFVRAVTQNRGMAGAVGVPTGRVDTLAFGLGAGIAGLGGLALSQISNVGPDMGQLYIVDSFMVVVLGGVGQLAGAVLAAAGLGVVGKFLEGMTGAVIAKILVLAFIIVFIQKRPQGLFALKGRFVES